MYKNMRTQTDGQAKQKMTLTNTHSHVHSSHKVLYILALLSSIYSCNISIFEAHMLVLLIGFYNLQ